MKIFIFGFCFEGVFRALLINDNNEEVFSQILAFWVIGKQAESREVNFYCHIRLENSKVSPFVQRNVSGSNQEQKFTAPIEKLFSSLQKPDDYRVLSELMKPFRRDYRSSVPPMACFCEFEIQLLSIRVHSIECVEISLSI